MKQPQPYFHSSHILTSAKVTVYFVESERLREMERHRERGGESKALPGFPPFGISRPGSAWRERLHYLPPPTPLNLPRPQNIQRGTLEAHPALAMAPQTQKPPEMEGWRRSECRENGCGRCYKDTKKKKNLRQSYIYFKTWDEKYELETFQMFLAND